MRDKYGDEGRYSGGVSSAYENFLKRVTVEFYYMGDRDDSRQYYAKLREEFSKDDYPQSYDRFIRKEMLSYIEGAGPEHAKNIVRGLLLQAYMNLGADANDRATALYNRAERIAKLWNDQRASGERERASQVVNFNDIRRSVLLDIFKEKVQMSPEVMEGLRDQLPERTVEILKEAAEEEKETKQLQRFELPEKFQGEKE
ncbi:MAG: hypothetical protein ACOC0A_03835, partial [Planctomycetota bacterium]